MDRATEREGPRGSRQDRASASEPREGAKFIARGVRLVYEDDAMLVIDKPTGLVTANPPVAPGSRRAGHGGGAGAARETLFDLVKEYVRRTGVRARKRARGTPGPRAYVVHRLDKEASGLLVFAKDAPTLQWLKEDFRAKRVHRLYLAVAEGVVGKPGDVGTRQSFIADESAGGGGGRRGAARADARRGGAPSDDAGESDSDDSLGRLAVTHYRVLGTAGDRTLLQVRLETGRKNQIRVHCSEMGHPLVGDRRFGAKTDAVGRLGLHAAELGFSHPGTGQSLRFSSPAPASFYRCVNMQPPEAKEEQRPSQPAQESGHQKEKVRKDDTSWERVAGWYDDLLEGRGNDHYRDVIIPGVLRMLDPRAGMRVLDLACGQGILSRRLATLGVDVIGADASASLVRAARARAEREPSAGGMRFEVCDARDIGPLGLRDLDACVCVMALSNIDPLEGVFGGVAASLKPGGTMTWVITHPAFRAAGQTDWGWDEKSRTQYRRVDGYLSAGQKQIVMNPGRGGDVTTITFHRPLQAYSQAMAKAGLLIERIEEWPSLRESTSGPRAVEENRARREIPLFLCVRCVKR